MFYITIKLKNDINFVVAEFSQEIPRLKVANQLESLYWEIYSLKCHSFKNCLTKNSVKIYLSLANSLAVLV